MTNTTPAITPQDQTDLSDTRQIIRTGLQTGYLGATSAVMVLVVRLHSMAGVPCPKLTVNDDRVAVTR